MRKSELFVLIQIGTMLYLLLSAPLYPQHVVSGILMVVAVILGAWAFFMMPLSTFSPMPVPRSRGKLVDSGPYRILRHPMYTAVILLFLILLLEYYTLTRLFVYLALVLNLIGKLLYEEELLKQRYEEYNAYRKKTYRLVPFLW